MKLKIAAIASEVAPFSKTGGLGDVSRSLSKALKRLGHQVIVITPFYERVISVRKNNLKLIFRDVQLTLNSTETVSVDYWQGELMPGLPVYFIGNKKYFSKKNQLYGSSHENARFMLFDVAALKLLSLLKFEAQIIQCHDWQTGLIPFYLKTDFRYSKTLQNAKTVFTIHNLAYQLGHNWWQVPGKYKDFGKKRLPHLADPAVEGLNFAKRGIMSADAITTVSEHYRKEILTKNFGQDLQNILRHRIHKLYGIINGIDYKDYNPAKDKNLAKQYDWDHAVAAKPLNKTALQKKLGLAIDPEIFVLASTSRVVFQKGFVLILQILQQLLKLNIQLVIMGDGDKDYISKLKAMQKKYPQKIVFLPWVKNKHLETLTYAGADGFLMPSHHEPCGINQLIAMRYGCVPIVRSVGGLRDTVDNYHRSTKAGTGFVFKEFTGEALYEAIGRALKVFNDQKKWHSLVVRDMKVSSSWEVPAKKYVVLFKKVINSE